MPDRVFPQMWKDVPGLDEWVWEKIESVKHRLTAIAVEVQMRQASFAPGHTLEFGYYLAYRSGPGAEPEVTGDRSVTRGPGRELLIRGYSLAEHVLPEEVTMLEYKVDYEMLATISAKYDRPLEPTPA